MTTSTPPPADTPALNPRIEAASLSLDPVPWRSGHPASLARRDAIRKTAEAALVASDEVMFSSSAISRAVSALAKNAGHRNVFDDPPLALAYRVDVLTVLSEVAGTDLLAVDAARNPAFADYLISNG